MSDAVIIRREGAVQVLALHRPDKLNALTGAMYGALSDAFEAGDEDEAVGAHVILGTPGIFTAGNDLADFLATAKAGGAVSAMGGEVVRFIRLLPQVKKPLVAGVDGKAIGIGTTLLFHCDLVYATANSMFATPFLDLGLVPEAGSSLLMPMRMGYARAFEMLVLGEPFDAARGEAAGFVNRIVPAEELEAVAIGAAKRLAAKPPEALTMARCLMRGDVERVVARVDEEARLFAERLSSKEARSAFEAFFARKSAKDGRGAL